MHILNIYFAYIVYFIYILLFQIKMVKSPNKNVKQKSTLVQLSVAQKQQVVLFATQNKDVTNLAIAEKFGNEFNLRIASQTLGGWLKDFIRIIRERKRIHIVIKVTLAHIYLNKAWR